MDFKNVIKNIRANESLGYLYTEKEVLTSHNLTVEQLTEGQLVVFVSTLLQAMKSNVLLLILPIKTLLQFTLF